MKERMLKLIFLFIIILYNSIINASQKNGFDLDDQEIGKVGLMSSVRNLPVDFKPTQKCSDQTLYSDCEYRDERGVLYSILDGVVVRIEVDGKGKGINLPFGLSIGDDRSVVIEKIQSYNNNDRLDGLVEQLRNGSSNASVSIVCSKNNEKYEFFLIFDVNKQLISVGKSVQI